VQPAAAEQRAGARLRNATKIATSATRRARRFQERMYAQPCCCFRITSTTPDGT
jgi:hypothetical protein